MTMFCLVPLRFECVCREFFGCHVCEMWGIGQCEVFDEMPERNVVSWNGMIYGYAQMGEDNEALDLFKRALAEGLGVDDFTFSSVICVCGNSTLLELGGKRIACVLK